MPAMVPALIGTTGLAAGEAYVLSDGTPVVVGRSRSCTISLRRAANYLKASSVVRDTDHDFNTVSRRHIRLTVTAGVAAVEDLSSNGTWCNGEPIHAPQTVDLNQGPCSLRLGTREQFELALVQADDPRIAGKEPVTEPAPTPNHD